jgi:hypothetical protein
VLCDDVTPYERERQPLRRHQGVRKACSDGGRENLWIVAIFRLEVASIDKRIDLPWVHLDFHHLLPELSAATSLP